MSEGPHQRYGAASPFAAAVGFGRGAAAHSSAWWRQRIIGEGRGFAQTLRLLLGLLIAIPILVLFVAIGLVILVAGAALVAILLLAAQFRALAASLVRAVTGRGSRDAEGREGVRVVRRTR